MSIPKNIFMTMSNKNKLNPIFSKNIETLKEKNKGWKFKFFDDKAQINFISKHYSLDYLNLYLSIDKKYGAARADYFRYLLMYKLGGVYLDIKSTCNKKLDDVIGIKDEYILSEWSKDPKSKYFGWGNHKSSDIGTELQQWHIICKPKHPFLKAVIDCVSQNIKSYQPLRDGVGKLGVLNMTGPLAYTRAIRPLIRKYKHRLVDIEQLGFDYSMLLSLGVTKKHTKFMPSNYRKLKRPIIKQTIIKTLSFYWAKYLLAGPKNLQQ